MLTPSPQDLRVALARYADARAVASVERRESSMRASADAAYTLCVMTGTQAVPHALHVADTMLGMPTSVSPALRRPAGAEQDNRLQTA